jgi:hypothetical protein
MIGVRLNIPLRLMSFLYYGSILLSLALCLLLSPAIVLYWLVLRWRIRQWRKEGKDLLIVFADTPSCQEWMKQISPLIGSRSEFLNWSRRDQWNRWSIGPQLFRFYLESLIGLELSLSDALGPLTSQFSTD